MFLWYLFSILSLYFCPYFKPNSNSKLLIAASRCGKEPAGFSSPAGGAIMAIFFLVCPTAFVRLLLFGIVFFVMVRQFSFHPLQTDLTNFPDAAETNIHFFAMLAGPFYPILRLSNERWRFNYYLQIVLWLVSTNGRPFANYTLRHCFTWNFEAIFLNCFTWSLMVPNSNCKTIFIDL